MIALALQHRRQAFPVRLLADGVELIERFDAARLAAAGLDPALLESEDYVPAGAVLDGADRFDWELFGYSRAEAETIDPQQRVFLMCAYEALEMAGVICFIWALLKYCSETYGYVRLAFVPQEARASVSRPATDRAEPRITTRPA